MDTTANPRDDQLEYERLLVGCCCWYCHRPTQISHGRQRYCSPCRAKWSFLHRQIQWELVKAFALGATAHHAARVLRYSYPTANRMYQSCRVFLRERLLAEWTAWLEEQKIPIPDSILRPRNVEGPSRKRNSIPRTLFAILECSGRVFAVEVESTSVRRIMAWLRRHRLAGRILTAAEIRMSAEQPSGRAVETAERRAGQGRRYYIDRIESFLFFCRRHLAPALGAPGRSLGLFLADYAFRFNHPAMVLDALFRAWIKPEIPIRGPEKS